MLNIKLKVRKIAVAAICFAGSATLTAQEEVGVEINGVIWATRNVGAPNTFVDNPEDYGMLYQWNSKVGWSTTDPMVSSDGSAWDRNWNGNAGNSLIWDNNVCPVGWRVPTPEEFTSLSNVDGEWGAKNGVTGYHFFYGNNSLFLPAAGSRDFVRGTYTDKGTGIYWHNRSKYAGSTSFLSVSKNGVKPPFNLLIVWGNAASIRCVKDENTKVNNISADTEISSVTGFFDILGRKLQKEPKKGFYIIRYDNGKIKKVMSIN